MSNFQAAMFNYFAVTFNFANYSGGLTTCASGHMKKFLRGVRD